MLYISGYSLCLGTAWRVLCFLLLMFFACPACLRLVLLSVLSWFYFGNPRSRNGTWIGCLWHVCNVLHCYLLGLSCSLLGLSCSLLGLSCCLLGLSSSFLGLSSCLCCPVHCLGCPVACLGCPVHCLGCPLELLGLSCSVIAFVVHLSCLGCPFACLGCPVACLGCPLHFLGCPLELLRLSCCLLGSPCSLLWECIQVSGLLWDFRVVLVFTLRVSLPPLFLLRCAADGTWD